MSIAPAPTTGIGVAAKIAVAGNVNPGVVTPGKNGVILSLSGANGPTSFQLNPEITDAAGTVVDPGTSFALTAVAAPVPGALVLTAAAINGVYTGTITGGGSNAFAGFLFTVAGFQTAANNGTFRATASTTTTLTLENTASAAETHAGTATSSTGTAVYTGTITGGATNAFAGLTFEVAGFTNATNNGSFIATASSATTLTLDNPASIAETASATAVSEEIAAGNKLTYFSDGTQNATAPGGSTVHAVVSVSSTGLITTNGVEGHSVVEVSFPAFNNGSGTTGAASPNPMTGLPLNKIYEEVNVKVVI